MNEGDLFEMILNWISCEPDHRLRYLRNLVELIRFGYIELDVLENRIKQNCFVRENRELIDHLDKVSKVLKSKKFELTKSRAIKYR